jgi:hypothetical protein
MSENEPLVAQILVVFSMSAFSKDAVSATAKLAT